MVYKFWITCYRAGKIHLSAHHGKSLNHAEQRVENLKVANAYYYIYYTTTHFEM